MTSYLSLSSARALVDPEDLDGNTAVHQALLDHLHQVAIADGWVGSTVSQRLVLNDHVSITIEPGDQFATMTDPRGFAARQLADRRKQFELT